MAVSLREDGRLIWVFFYRAWTVNGCTAAGALAADSIEDADVGRCKSSGQLSQVLGSQ